MLGRISFNHKRDANPIPADFPDEPIPLITFSESEDQLEVNHAAVDVLQRIEGHVAVIAIAGLYRTGKSSMLNWLLDRQSGFRVGPTIERCTRGIWLWGRPQRRKLSNGEDIWVLMLDTEGLGGLEASQQYDARIFSLATLLCSKLIYNSQGSVDEKAISGLSFIANLAKHIKVSADSGNAASNRGGNDEDAMQFHQFFPSFMWVVRDFTLELVDEDGDPITSNDYLERALADQPRIPANMERNRIRTMMKDFFRDRDCVTLVRPVHDEAQLQQIDKLAIPELRPEFQEQLAELKNLVFGSTLRPKTLQGKPLNGSMFAGLLEAYVDAINSGGVPVIASAWEDVTASECRKAVTTAVDTFKALMSEVELPIDDEELQAVFKDSEQRALQTYRSNAIGEMTAKLEADVEKKVEEVKAQLVARNAEQSKEMCERLLQTMYSDKIQPHLTSASSDDGGFSSIQQFTQEWERFRNDYLASARGGAKLECLLMFSEAKYAEAMRILLSRHEEGYEKTIRSLQGDVSRVKEELGSVGGREQIYKEQIEQMQMSTSQVLADKARFEAEAEAQRERISQLEEMLRGEAETKQSVEVERESMDLRLTSEVQMREDVANELLKVKQEFERVAREKLEKEQELQQQAERLRKQQEDMTKQQKDLTMLTQECEQLRQGKKGCQCVVS